MPVNPDNHTQHFAQSRSSVAQASLPAILRGIRGLEVIILSRIRSDFDQIRNV